ncbi:MAG: hypothetical protein ACREXS_03800 [Gammaproteobacteria bacterium]
MPPVNGDDGHPGGACGASATPRPQRRSTRSSVPSRQPPSEVQAKGGYRLRGMNRIGWGTGWKSDRLQYAKATVTLPESP